MAQDTIGKIKKAASDTWEDVKEGRLGDKIRAGIADTVKANVETMRRTGDVPGYRGGNMMGTPISKSVAENVSDTWEDIKSGAKKLWDEGYRKVMGSKRKGGRIKKTGLYRLHRGEAVRRSRGR